MDLREAKKSKKHKGKVPKLLLKPGESFYYGNKFGFTKAHYLHHNFMQVEHLNKDGYFNSVHEFGKGVDKGNLVISWSYADGSSDTMDFKKGHTIPEGWTKID